MKNNSMLMGIEIGGTKLQACLADSGGTIAHLWRATVDASRRAQGIRDSMREALPSLVARIPHGSRLTGVGVGFGGPVDSSTGKTIISHQIQGWENFPLAEWLEKILKVRALVGNDADVAGLGEATKGAGVGHDPVFYITVGSGIGGGLILGGKIHPGCGRGAAEIGHLMVDRHGEILEHVASGWGIQRRFAAAVQAGARTSVTGPSPTVQGIALAARAGDALAMEALAEATNALAWGVCQTAALVCPRRFVIGGGVSLLGEDLFFGPLRAAVDRMVFKPFHGLFDIIPAALGEEVVLHGALSLAAGAAND
jgi:glucokinase